MNQEGKGLLKVDVRTEFFKDLKQREVGISACIASNLPINNCY